MRNLLFLLSCLLFDLVIGFDAPTLVVQSPTHQESITIHRGSSVRLQCRGNHPISWSYPTAALNESRIEINTRYSSRRNTHVSQLVLENSTSADTGFYGCRHETNELGVSDVSSLYIFVTDPDTLFKDKDELKFVGLGPNRTNIIPCLVNNPSAQVTLTRVNGNEELRLNQDILYDPRLGFSLLFPNVYFNGQFECKAQLGPKTDTRRFILHYFASTSMPRPHIIMKSKELTEGNRLKLTCRTLIAADTLMTVKWTKNGRPLEGGSGRRIISPPRKRIFEHEEVSHGYRYAEVKMAVTIPCITTRDSGEYRCIVEDHNGHTNSQSIDLNIRENERNPGRFPCFFNNPFSSLGGISSELLN